MKKDRKVGNEKKDRNGEKGAAGNGIPRASRYFTRSSLLFVSARARTRPQLRTERPSYQAVRPWFHALSTKYVGACS